VSASIEQFSFRPISRSVLKFSENQVNRQRELQRGGSKLLIDDVGRHVASAGQASAARFGL
jgi:hypothetical protein